MQNTSYSLRMEGITKTFGPVTALNNVSFSARPGTVHALCGENGAGKSTLMKVLAGVHLPDAGRIFIAGCEQVFNQPAAALKAGISMLYQELDLAPDLSICENIYLGHEIPGRFPFKLDHSAMLKQTRQLIASNGFELDPEARIGDLPPGDCQIAELLKALMREAKIIVMDEPTSSLSEKEAKRLFAIIRRLRQRGITIIYISHRMEEITALADDISILRDGEVVHFAPAAELDIDTIVRHMVGRRLNDFYPPREPAVGEHCFTAEHISSVEGVNDVSFNIRHGEIVGMSGLVGAGRTETARAICGIVPKTSGSMLLNGKKLSVKTPGSAIRHGIAYLTEDRKRTGLCTNLACSWNISLPNYERIGMKNFIRPARERRLATEAGEKIKVKWSAPDAPADSLSGGNQQKVLIARWLEADSEFIIFDEPTRGIDVGAKHEVYTILDKLAQQHKAILVISSDLPELFGICDRILVMCRGRLVGNLNVKETTPEAVMHLAAQ